MSSGRAVGRTIVILALALTALVGAAAPVAADEAPQTELQKVVAAATAQLGAHWSFAAVGPNQFDCSGLVTFAYKSTGLLDRIGGKRRTVAGFYKWFNNRGLANKENPLPGDLVVWGRNEHIGIYLGDGLAISALINPYGVKIHKVSGYIPMKVKAYLHVDLQR